jgi:hypothetical protein
MNDKQITDLDTELNLNDLFAIEINEDKPFIDETLEPIASVDLEIDIDSINTIQNLEVVSTNEELLINEHQKEFYDKALSSSQVRELSTFDSLFGEEETQAGLPSEQPEFCDLFEQPKKVGESSNFLEEIIPTSSSKNAASVNLWEEESKLESELKIEAEDLLSSNASDRFVDELSATGTFTFLSTEAEATTANGLNVHDDSLNTEEAPSSLFDDFWDEQLDLDLPPVSEIGLSTELPKSEEISTKAPLKDNLSVTNELDLALDTTETDFFNSLGERTIKI